MLNDEFLEKLAEMQQLVQFEYAKLRDSYGEIIATIRLNWDKGYLTVPEEGKETFNKLLEKWEKVLK